MTRPALDETFDARASISAAAIRLFTAHGYDATTMDQIARESGSSRATVFRYFGSKEGILFQRYDREFVDLCAGVGDRKGSDARRTRTVLMEVAGRLQTEADAFRLELDLIAGNPKLRARSLVTLHAWACVLAAELAAGHDGDTDLAARVVAHSGVAALQQAICMWRVMSPETSLVDVAAEALRLALPGGRRG